MGPYLFLIFIVTLLATIALLPQWASRKHIASRARVRAQPAKPTALFDLLIVLALIVFAGFRYYVGTDFLLYELLFKQLDPNSWTNTLARSPQEMGFTVFSLVIRTFTDNVAWLFFLASTITVGAAYWAMRTISVNVTLSLLTYVLFAQYLFSFNVIRQSIAISVIYLGLAFWLRGKRALPVMLALLAIGFHFSAIIAIVVFIVANFLRNTRLTIAGYLFVVLPTSFGVKLLLDLPIVKEIAFMLNPRYARYLFEGNSAGLGTYLVLSVLIGLGLLFVIYLGETAESRWLVLIFVAAVPFMVLGTSIIELARVANYFSFALVLLVPLMLQSNSQQSRFWGGLVILMGYLYFLVYLQNYDGLLPYQDVWGFLPRGEMNIHIPK